MMDKKEAVLYIQDLVSKEMELPYYNVKRFLELNSVKIANINFEDTKSKRLEVLSVEPYDTSFSSVSLTISEKSWIEYLPSIYKKNDDLKRFLYGFQVTMFKQTQVVDNIDNYFIPQKSDFLDWLASWFGVGFSQSVTSEAKRELIYKLIDLYKKRGTKDYLVEMVDIITGHKITIIERKIPEFYLQDDYTSENFNKNISFTVKIDQKLSEDKDEEILIFKKIKNILDKEKPAFTQYFFDYEYIKEEVKGDVLVAEHDNNPQDYLEDIIDYDTQEEEPAVDHFVFEKDEIQEEEESVSKEENVKEKKKNEKNDEDFFDYDDF